MLSAVTNLSRIVLLLVRLSRGVKHSRLFVWAVVVSGVAGGVCNTAILAVINSALNGPGAFTPKLVWGFAGLCLVIAFTRFVSGAVTVRLMQRGMFDLRMNLCRQILEAPLRVLEQVGAPRLMATLTSDIPNITEGLITLPLMLTNLAVMLGCLIYLGLLSWWLLLGVLCFMALGIVSYQVPVAAATRHFARAREAMDALFKHLRGLTEGTKELKLHRRRSEAFVSEMLRPTTITMLREAVAGQTIWSAANGWGQALFFTFIGLVIFAVPALRPTSPAVLTGYTLAILYIMGPLEFLLNSLPRLGHADVAMRKIDALSAALAGHPMNEEARAEHDAQPSWRLLELRGVTHAYRGETQDTPFTLGPLDLELRPGEVVFITGGNGSGKTTLAKLLLGLYAPESGEIRLDGVAVTNENRDRYRQLFSAVFSDFYLFESLLGLDAANLDESANSYLAQLQLERGVRVADGVLSTLDLSQGQRKRLALLTAYLEDRPIYLFDEWAADQDPHFKALFYLEMLPELKRAGKTALVISHDDRYFNVADRIIRLDYGRKEYDEWAGTGQGLAAV